MTLFCSRCVRFGNDVNNPLKHEPENCPKRKASLCETRDDFYELGQFDFLEGYETPISLRSIPAWAEADYLAGYEDARKEEEGRYRKAEIIAMNNRKTIKAG